MSFLNTTHTTTCIRPLPRGLTAADALDFLHQAENVVTLNPNLLRCSTRSARPEFWTSEAAGDRPIDVTTAPVFDIVEREGGTAGPSRDAGLYGGLAKKLVGDEVRYTMGFRATDVGLVTISHAMLGVWSRVTWVVREAREGEEGGDGVGKGLVVDETGEVRCNRALMVFVKPTLQSAHDKLVDSFVETLAKRSNRS